MEGKVKLVVPEKGMTIEVDAGQAERILGMAKNGGWKLPKDSKFTYSKEHGIRVKGNKGKVQDPEEQVADQQGD